MTAQDLVGQCIDAQLVRAHVHDSLVGDYRAGERSCVCDDFRQHLRIRL
eukprot:CAMPEP_0195597592 /NCGR_PEP_ID=MMETSP0815-20121206/3065_1 /TAXON_ID=97485 /ORGANISM="Prymnesium parvum, Strain Texoma1" /LENGTH=48 /DNA_ID= /DNA_START= /DNA_END= /DNA_ORIENTATION=